MGMYQRAVWPGMLALLTGCALTPDPSQQVQLAQTPWATQSKPLMADGASAPATPEWRHLKLPGKTPTQFNYTRKDDRDALAVLAESSASMLRSATRIEPVEMGKVRFSWRVPQLIANADMALRDADDSPVRIILAFEGDRTKFTQRDAMLSELAHTLTGEPMPYATLMYVWCNKRAPGTVIPSPRTDRIRKMVVESGATNLNQWLDYERDIRADFERAFGEAPGALVGIGIMTDSDNTRSTAKAWYGPVRLAPFAANKD